MLAVTSWRHATSHGTKLLFKENITILLYHKSFCLIMTQQQELNQTVAHWSKLHLSDGSEIMEFFTGIFCLDCKEAKNSAYHSNINSFYHKRHIGELDD